MKVIRANRNIFVPVNPENPDGNLMRPVQSGLIAIIPSDFQIPEDAYTDLGELKLKEPKKDK